jgi:hypothetical protein
LSWWGPKVRQTRAHLAATVSAAEREGLVTWMTPAQVAVFDSMHAADRRHGLDVVATLRGEGVTDEEVLVAGLLHDCGKGDAGLVARVVWSLGERYGGWIHGLAGLIPGLGATLERLRTHAERSAQLALAAGCTSRTADLIRYQDAPRAADAEAGRLLKLADEAN